MRKRLLPSSTALALTLGLLTATPAAATYAVESITFPGDRSEFYSPFSGPASIRFTFEGDEQNATFELRIRRAGGTAIHTHDVFVTPDEPGLFEIEEFTWPAISVQSGKEYVVAVYRNRTQVASDSFFLLPRLVTVTGATPNPFFPWIDDGYKDTTNVGFDLTADADVEAHVFRPNGVGKCCGTLVRDDGLGSLLTGNRNWSWDGRDEAGDNLAKGDYFVKIRAEDVANVVRWSKPSEVSIARTYRARKSRSKPATSFHHTSPDTAFVIGGGCNVHIDNPRLEILCQGAKVTVFWTWALAANERIERSSVLLDDPGDGCPAIGRKNGHTKHGSSFTVSDTLSGRYMSCDVLEARITYSYPKAS
jgi:FlgD Ig-like domain